MATYTTIDAAAIVGEMFGKRWKINQAEMAAALAKLAEAGISLENDCVIDGHSPEDWARSCKGINCISMLPPTDQGRYHGSIRYDQPGQLHPLFHAAVMFVPETVSDPSYLRHHCDRLFVVKEGGLVPELAAESGKRFTSGREPIPKAAFTPRRCRGRASHARNRPR